MGDETDSKVKQLDLDISAIEKSNRSLKRSFMTKMKKGSSPAELLKHPFFGPLCEDSFDPKLSPHPRSTLMSRLTRPINKLLQTPSTPLKTLSKVIKNPLGENPRVPI